MMTRSQKVVYGLGIVLVLAVGVVATASLLMSRKQPPRQKVEAVGPLVNVVVATRKDVELTVAGHGTVRAKVQAQVVPQVGGRVAKVHPSMVSGGYIPAGEAIVTLDDSDYQLALQQAEASKAAAEAAKSTAEAQIAEAQANVADRRDDIERIGELVKRQATNERELRKAETALDIATALLNRAQAGLASAQSQLATAQVQSEQAKLNIQRTVVTLPFDAMVTSESVDAGQFVTAGQPIASVYGTKAVEIPVPLEDEQLKWFTQVPLAHEIASRQTARDDLPIADVFARFAGQDCQWIGRVVRSEGAIDPRTRMVHVIVEVEDPLPAGAAGDATSKPPLIPGAFVNVEIRGKALVGVFEIPRHALHHETEVWVVREGKLRVRQVEVARTEHSTVYLRGGIEEGDLVVTTPLDTVADEMKVRVPEEFAERAGMKRKASGVAAPIDEDADAGALVTPEPDTASPAPTRAVTEVPTEAGVR